MADVPDKRTVIVDCDPGIDDAMALFTLLAAHRMGRVNVIGLTTTQGNHHDQDLLAKNACFILESAGLADGSIKVVKGSPKPMTTEYHGYSGIEVHSETGLGNVKIPDPVRTPMEHEHETAVDYLIETCKARPGDVTLVALGPLTNLGHAVQKDPEFAKTVKQVVLMGGSIDGRGNKTPASEANLHNDPEAGKLVFDAFESITMAGLNVTRQVSLPKPFRETLSSSCGPVGRFLADIHEHYVELLESWGSGAYIHDSSAVMALLHPELFPESTDVHVAVETEGTLTRGVTVADWMGHWSKPPNTKVLQTVDADAMRAKIAEYVSTYTEDDLKWPLPSDEAAVSGK